MSNTHPPGAAGAPHDGATAGVVWLVGLRHRGGSGVLVRHYYVVAGTSAGVDALRRARWFAAQLTERLLRGDAVVDGTWAEVRRLTRDTLGRYRLAGQVG